MANRITGVISVSLQCIFIFHAVLLHALLWSGPCIYIFCIYRRLSALAVFAGFFDLLLLCSIICSGGMRKSFSVFHVIHIYTCTPTVKNKLWKGFFILKIKNKLWKVPKNKLWKCSSFLQHKWAVPLNISNHFQFWPCVQPGCNGEAYPHMLYICSLLLPLC